MELEQLTKWMFEDNSTRSTAEIEREREKQSDNDRNGEMGTCSLCEKTEQWTNAIGHQSVTEGEESSGWFWRPEGKGAVNAVPSFLGWIFPFCFLLFPRFFFLRSLGAYLDGVSCFLPSPSYYARSCFCMIWFSLAGHENVVIISPADTGVTSRRLIYALVARTPTVNQFWRVGDSDASFNSGVFLHLITCGRSGLLQLVNFSGSVSTSFPHAAFQFWSLHFVLIVNGSQKEYLTSYILLWFNYDCG